MHRSRSTDGTTGNRPRRRGAWRALCLSLAPSSLLFLSGCAWDGFGLFRPEPPPRGPVDSLVLRGDQLEAEKPLKDEKSQGAQADLAGAHELCRLGDFAAAEKVYHRIAENKKNLASLAEEARFYEAECLRRQERYPKACDTYHKVLLDFPSGAYREQSCQRMFDIANYWLDDTRQEMQMAKEKAEGKRSMIWTPVVHFEKAKPFMDEEGRAIEALERVHYNDITGPLADKALFLCGSVMFYRENYREADHYFTQLVEQHRNSPMAAQAVELGIISKHMGTGGADYDGRKVAEARQLINTALANYPTLATEKKDFLVRQLSSCNMQQAEKDYKIAEFYKRTGHPGSAWFYFEIVRRRYPGTPFFDRATEAMHELRRDLEKDPKAVASMPAPPAAPGGAAPQTPGSPDTLPAPRVLPPAGEETAPQPRPVPPAGVPERAPAPRLGAPNMIGGGTQ